MPFAKAKGVLSLRDIMRLAAKEEALSKHPSVQQNINSSPDTLRSKTATENSQHDFSKLTHEVVKVNMHSPVASAKSGSASRPRGILKTGEQNEAATPKPLNRAKAVRFSPVAKVAVFEGFEEREAKLVLVVTWHGSSASKEDTEP